MSWNDSEMDSFPWEDEMVQELVPLALSAPPQQSPEFEELPDIPPRLPAQLGRFRLQATAFFLTYSRCFIPRDRMIAWWNRQTRVKRLIVAQEEHQDGNPHFHVVVEYDIKKDIRSERHYDILGCHPNIKVWGRKEPFDRWLHDCWQYCKKADPTPYIVGEEPRENRKRKRDEIFLEAMELAKSEGVRQAMGYLQDRCPYDVCTKYQQIEGALCQIRKVEQHVEIPCNPLTDYVNAPRVPDEWNCLYIWGPTGCGKTEWAAALLPGAPIVRHSESLRGLDFSKGVIFDDFDVSDWKPVAAIHLLDWNRPSTINIKHSSADIPAYTKKIVTFNLEFQYWLPNKTPFEQIVAVRRRVTEIEVTGRLFA